MARLIRLSSEKLNPESENLKKKARQRWFQTGAPDAERGVTVRQLREITKSRDAASVLASVLLISTRRPNLVFIPAKLAF